MFQVWEKLFRIDHIHVDIVEIPYNHVGPPLELVEINHLGDFLGLSVATGVSEYDLAVCLI